MANPLRGTCLPVLAPGTAADASVAAVVVGAGVVGLAVARALARAGLEVVVLEAAEAIGTGTSSRNSEVIHAGVHYPPGSLKAALCVRGRDMLYRYCASHGIPHARCGKLVVASQPQQLPALTTIARRAAAAGAGDLELLQADRIRALEPEVAAVAGLWSPDTGIVDSHALMLALLGDLEAAGGSLALQAPVTAVAQGTGGEGLLVQIAGSNPMVLQTDVLVNAAGHGSWDLALAVAGLAANHVPPQFLARGHYYSLQGANPFRHLVYPVPEPGGLGIHVTLDLAGQARFGPDVEWCQHLDYRFDDQRRQAFVRAIASYWPAVTGERLVPGYVGIRPKLSGPDDPAADFLVQGPGQHGIAGLVNLFGLESPGLTSCLALADEVLGRLQLPVAGGCG